MIELNGELDFHNKKVKEAMRFALKNTLLECGVRASNQAKILAPVLTGRLRASIGPTAALPVGEEPYIKLDGMVTVTKKVNGKEKTFKVRAVHPITWAPGDFEKTGAYQQEEDLRASIIVGTNVKYASFVEFGTYKIKAHPYLTPAMNMEAEKMKSYAPASFRRYFRIKAKQLGVPDEK